MTVDAPTDVAVSSRIVLFLTLYIDFIDIQGTIPMHLAAQGGHLLVAGLLISRTSEQLHRSDKYGRTPLHLAASFGHRDMVSLLLGQGANINTQDNVSVKICFHLELNANHLERMVPIALCC